MSLKVELNMASQTDVREDILQIPSSSVRRKQGCSFDIGGSLIKFAYAVDAGNTVQIRMFCFPRDSLEEALVYLKTKVGSTVEEQDLLNTTGVGSYNHNAFIKETLGKEVTLHAEFACFSRAFVFLNKLLPVKDTMYPQSDDVTKSMWSLQKLSVQLLTNEPLPEEYQANESTSSTKSNYENQEEGNTRLDYPLLLLTCGSAAVPLLVHADGSFKWYHHETIAGRYFLGLGSLLTGAKTFDELLQLAEVGDPKQVDTIGKDLTEGQGECNYKYMPPDVKIYGFGKVADNPSETFKKEDLAAGLLLSVAENLAKAAHFWSLILNVKDVVFAGGLVDKHKCPRFRDEIAKRFIFQNMAKLQDKSVDHYFMKYGTYLGAIGALLVTLQKE